MIPANAINILVAINLIASMGANLSAARKGMKQTITNYVVKPRTYLQKIPANITAIVLILEILAVFNIGTINEEISNEWMYFRLVGFLIFVVFSWLQVRSYKSLGNNYSQDIAIIKNHNLVMSGPYKFIRHPQYVCQVLSDLGAGIALAGYIIIPIVLLLELPLLMLRAAREDKLMEHHFGDEFTEYKNKSGFIFPFIG